MREITDHKVNGLNEALNIRAIDEPGLGGANHVYEISYDTGNTGGKVLTVPFQNGGIKDVGVNGISIEALLAIAADRLKSFQSGQFSTRENAVALTHIETAMLWLHKRTHDRMRRGVEGTLQK
jgi:hypothetical protein